LKAFQKALGVPQTGAVDAATITAFDKALEAAKQPLPTATVTAKTTATATATTTMTVMPPAASTSPPPS